MKQKKEKRITLRLTPEQYEAIQSKAETAQMSTGAYVRAAALQDEIGRSHIDSRALSA